MEEDILIELIRINSESGNEKDIGEFIKKRLERSFKIAKQNINDNFNLFVSAGDPKIIFCAHLDTVPEKIPVKSDGKFIYGRGACDNKSQIAAMILAAEEARKKGLIDFGLLFTVQEETDFAGAKKACELIPESTKLIVIGEPTNFSIVSGQKGLLTLKLICRGKSAHGSTPEKGVNAIELLIDNLKKLREINFDKNESIGENSLNVGIIKGGSAVNVVPDYAEATIEIRNTVNPEVILNQIKKELDVEIEIVNSYEPVFNQNAEELARKLKLKIKTVPYFTEMYFFGRKTSAIVLGAGLEEDAHSKNEKVKINDFKKLIEIYFKILEEYVK